MISMNTLASEYVVIVNEKNPISKISKNEISQILLVNKTDWPSGKGISIINYNYDSDAAENLFKNFAGMSALQAKKMYLTKVFNGVIQKKPTTHETTTDIIEAVAENVNAVSLIEKTEKINTTVKALTIE